jgi:hypothetical protein
LININTGSRNTEAYCVVAPTDKLKKTKCNDQEYLQNGCKKYPFLILSNYFGFLIILNDIQNDDPTLFIKVEYHV